MISNYRPTPSGEPAAEPLLDGDDEEASQPASALGSAEEVETRQAVVPAGFHGQRLDKLLVELAPEFSRNHLQGLIAAGHVSIEGVATDAPARKLRAGQQVVMALWPTQESRAYRAESLPLNIVFEDEGLMVVNKAAGMVVHPAAGNWSGTLLNGLLAYHAGSAGLARAGIVHRLDKDTSGVMVVGKTLAAVTALSRAIAAREVHREYLALAHGVLPEGTIRIDTPIGRDPKSRVRMAIVAGGRTARTDVQLLGVAADERSCALRCTLHTGRTHQIRVHLASRGHPLVADAVYGGAPLWGLKRQALHAARLGFNHPLTGAALSFEAPLPDDLAQAWAHVVDHV